MKSNHTYSAILLGILAAAFFAVTFIVNRLISNEGGSWIWAASLRFFWMLPFLLIMVWQKRHFRYLWQEMGNRPIAWMIWSTIGFGIFYAPLTFAAQFAPSWLLAGTWQVTIIAGMLITPLITPSKSQPFSLLALFFSCIMLLGIVLMQANYAQQLNTKILLLSTLPVLLAAFAYPLGNRKMMQLTAGRLTATERVLGMTLASMPFWLILSTFALIKHDIPNTSQLGQTLLVALFSGLIATTLFFKATDKVKHDNTKLAAVEATQSAEVLFALLGEVLFLQAAFPNFIASIGILLVMIGMILHSINKR